MTTGNPTRGAGTVRRGVGWAAVAVLLLGGSATAAEEQARTETTLGGYKVGGAAAPLRVLFDDPSIPLPRDAGAPLLHADVSYTQTALSSGPQARALAASFWPGPLVGDGLPTIMSLQPVIPPREYPVKADARFPAGPVESTGPAGSTLEAKAKGLDVDAHSTASQSLVPDVAFDKADSRTTSGVTTKDVATTRAAAVVDGAELLGGLVQVDSVRTVLEAASDGKKARTTGTTVVQGLTVAGQGYVVDEQGVRPVSGGKPGSAPAPLPGGAADPLTALGITVEPLSVSEKVEGTSATRSSGGLRIVVDTAALNAALQQLPYNDVLSSVPSEPDELDTVVALGYQLFSTTPKVTYVLGSASASTAANPAFVFSAPLPDAAPAPPATDSGATGQAPLVTGTGAGPGDDPSGGTGLGDTPPPALDLQDAPLGGDDAAATADLLAAPDLGLPVDGASPVRSGFGGIGFPLLALALLASLGGSRGLLHLHQRAFGGGGGLGRGCPLGASDDVLDLRSA